MRWKPGAPIDLCGHVYARPHRSSRTDTPRLAGSGRRSAASGWRGVLKLVWASDPIVLNKHKNELAYLLEKLNKLEGDQVTSEQWQEFYESWMSLLALRPKLNAECAQRVLRRAQRRRLRARCLPMFHRARNMERRHGSH